MVEEITKTLEESSEEDDIELETMFRQIFENEFEEWPHIRSLEEKANHYAKKEIKSKERLKKHHWIFNNFFRDRRNKFRQKRKSVGRGYKSTYIDSEDAQQLLDDTLHLKVEENSAPVDLPEEIQRVYEFADKENEIISEHFNEDREDIRLLLNNGYSPDELDQYEESVVKDVKKTMEWEEKIEEDHNFSAPVFYNQVKLDDPANIVADEIGVSALVIYQFRGYNGEKTEENMIFDIRGVVPRDSVINPRLYNRITADREYTKELRY